MPDASGYTKIFRYNKHVALSEINNISKVMETSFCDICFQKFAPANQSISKSLVLPFKIPDAFGDMNIFRYNTYIAL